MPKKESTLVNTLLFSLYSAGGLLSMILVSPYQRGRRLLYGKNHHSYKSTIYNLKKRGIVETFSKNGEKFLRLTKKGQLEVLLAKAKLPNTAKWDGKWRLIIFDIPKQANHHRDHLRKLLKKSNFRLLQASVYASPQPLNREAITYLQETGLIQYIRIMKVEEMDNDKDLRKKFGLK